MGFLSVQITLMNRLAGSLQEAVHCAVIRTISVFLRFLSAMGKGTAGMDQMKLTAVSRLSDLNQSFATEFYHWGKSSRDGGRVVTTWVSQNDSHYP